MASPARSQVSPSFACLPARRDAALDRLDAFLQGGLRHYATSRNADLGPADRSNVSTLSPYIRHRLILEPDVLRSVLACSPLSRAEKFVQELFWRSYFKGWLEHHPAVWFAYRQDVLRFRSELERDRSLRDRYEAAVTGHTGIECFDAWSEELVAEGYLHNHTRMWFASIWTFTLGLPWQLGADFFLRHLLDGDAASNTLGWRWVAGLHTRGKTYLARPDNIRKYTVGRFNPEPSSLASVAEPLTETDSPRRVDLDFPNGSDGGDSLPDSGRYGLLLTDDDCSPESLGLSRPPAATIGLSSAADRSPFMVGAAVQRFAAEAIEDGMTRLHEAFDCDGEVHHASDWGERLTGWATEHRLAAIVVAATPQGPANDLLGVAERRLRAEGIDLVRKRRSYDLAVWPHATRGFFKLRKAIPAILESQKLLET